MIWAKIPKAMYAKFLYQKLYLKFKKKLLILIEKLELNLGTFDLYLRMLPTELHRFHIVEKIVQCFMTDICES